MRYVIEHMDPELWEWSAIEYRHAAQQVGKENLLVSNLPQDEEDKLEGCCETDPASVSAMNLPRVCVLDPEAEKELSPEDAQRFDHLVFGGILGDYPPKARTRELKVPGAERRNLGKEQLSTDNAVMVAKMIVGEGKRLAELEFVEEYVVPMDDGEEIILPFRYLLIDGKPFIADEIVEYVKEHGF